MLHLTFENPALPRRDMGPYAALEVTAQALWGMPGRVQIATHEDSMWVSPEREYYTSIAIRTPCVLRFRHDGIDCSKARKREADARIVNGAIYHGGKLIATVNESQNTWRIYEDKTDCDAAEILPAPATN